jgi:WD40 repeat protein
VRDDTPGERYDVFLSYSHNQRSSRIAAQIQSRLRRFARPWYRAQAFRVFRDTTDLTASPSLWTEIEAALAGSDWFVLIASPEATQSRWVRQEIAWWLANRSVDHMVIVVVDGALGWRSDHNRFDPTSTAIPTELRDAFTEEPLWIDLTARSDDSPVPPEPILQHGVASIAARIRGVSLSRIFGAQVAQQRRTRLTVAAVMALLVLLASGALAASAVALRQRDAAVAAADRAGSNSLVLQSAALARTQVDRALLTGIAAAALDPSAQARANLITNLVGTRYAGTLPHPAEPVAAVGFSPDGRLAVTAHTSGIARLWDVTNTATARELATIDMEAAIHAAAISPDGLVLALDANRDPPSGNSVTLWDIDDPTHPRRIADLPEHFDTITDVIFSPDGQRLYSTGISVQGGAEIRVYDVNSPGQPHEVLGLFRAGQWNSVTASPAGDLVVFAGPSGLQVWRSDGSVLLHTIEPRNDTVYASGIAPDGRTLVTCSGNGVVGIYDITDPTAPRLLAETPRFDQPALGCTISPDGQLIAFGDGSGAIHLYDVRDPTRPVAVSTLPGHSDAAFTVAFSPDSALLLSGSTDGTTLAWHTADPTAPVLRTRAATQVGVVRSVAVSDDGTLAYTINPPTVLTGEEEGKTVLTDINAPGNGRVLAVHATRFGDVVSFAPDGRTLLTATEDGGVYALRRRNAAGRVETIGTIATPNIGVYIARWSRDGAIILLSGGGTNGRGATTVWDVSDQSNPIKLHESHDVPDPALAISPDGRYMARAYGVIAQRLELWDMTDPSKPRIANGFLGSHTSGIADAAFDPRGGVIATASSDHTAALWRVPSGERLATLRHDGDVNAIAYADGGSMLATRYAGGVALWDVRDPTLPVRLQTIRIDPDNPARAFAVSPDGRTLVVARDSGELEVWDLGRIRDIVDDPVAAACALTGRGLREDEWLFYSPERPFRPTCRLR